MNIVSKKDKTFCDCCYACKLWQTSPINPGTLSSHRRFCQPSNSCPSTPVEVKDLEVKVFGERGNGSGWMAEERKGTEAIQSIIMLPDHQKVVNTAPGHNNRINGNTVAAFSNLYVIILLRLQHGLIYINSIWLLNYTEIPHFGVDHADPLLWSSNARTSLNSQKTFTGRLPTQAYYSPSSKM